MSDNNDKIKDFRVIAATDDQIQENFGKVSSKYTPKHAKPNKKNEKKSESKEKVKKEKTTRPPKLEKLEKEKKSAKSTKSDITRNNEKSNDINLTKKSTNENYNISTPFMNDRTSGGSNIKHKNIGQKAETAYKERSKPKKTKEKNAENKKKINLKTFHLFKKNIKKVEKKNGMTVIKNPKKKSGFQKFFIAVAIVVAAIITVNIALPVGLIEYTGNFFSGLGTGKGFPVSISASASRNIASSGNDIVLLGDSSVMLYKKNGKIIFNRTHNFSNPAIVTSDSRILVYDRGGSSFRVENRTRLLYDIDIENEIITAGIAENGSFAIASYSDKYVSDVTVYSKNGDQKMQWHSSDRQVVSLALSRNGKYMSVGTLAAQGGEYISQILIFRVKDGKILTEQTYEKSVIASLNYNRGYVVGVFNNMLTSVNTSGKRTDYTVENGKISCFAKNKNGVVISVQKFNDDENNIILIFNNAMKNIGTVDLDCPANAVSMKGKNVVALSNDSIILFNKNGVKKKTKNLDADAHRIVSVNSGVACLCSSTLEFVKI